MNRPLTSLICATLIILAGIAITPAKQDTKPTTPIGLVQDAGISKGICSVIGGDPALPVQIAESSEFLVHALATDSKAADAAKAKADAKALHGQRVIVETGNLPNLPYADNMIDLLIAPDLDASLQNISPQEILRVLRPGGKAVLSGPIAKELKANLKTVLKQVEADDKNIADDGYTITAGFTKPQNPGTDSWTHWNYAPHNNPMSTDSVIKAPYRTQWMGGPLYTAMPAVTTIAGGRNFLAMGHIAHHEREEQWLNTLVARNGYNGTILWTRKLGEGYMVHRSAFIASEDVFYMIDNDRCLMLDPESGDEIGEIRIPGLEGKWKWMAMQDGALYVLAGGKPDVAETRLVKRQTGHWSWGHLSKGYYEAQVPWGFGKQLAAYNMKKEKTLWTVSEETNIDSRSLAMNAKRIFAYAPDGFIKCYKTKSGKEVWDQTDAEILALIERKPDREAGEKLTSTPGFRSSCFSMCTEEAVYFEAQTRMNVLGLSAEDGSLLWTREKTTNNPNLMAMDGNILVGIGKNGRTLALDPLTGETVGDLKFQKAACTRLTGCPDALFVRGEGLLRYQRESGKVIVNGAVRPGCNDGAIPANGLLYVGPWLCDCNLQLIGSVAMAPAGDLDFSEALADESRLENGNTDPRAVAPFPISENDWPVYRADNNHSNGTAVRAAPGATEIWSYMPDSDTIPAAPTSAGGLVFIGADDGKVRAIDAATGDLVWSYMTAGPIKAPPSIVNGRAYVGSGDGYIYCLSAATGRMIWRYRAAPAERKIMLYGKLCSAWPVNSGVLVQDGVAYAAAGIIDYDGASVCAIDALTGKPKWENTTSAHLNEETRKGVSPQGTLAIAGDILWLAGGHMVGPAMFNLETGECLNRAPDNTRGTVSKGQEMMVFNGDYLIYGGRLQHSSPQNVVDSSTFYTYPLEWGTNEKLKGLQILGTKIPPAWNQNTVAWLGGMHSLPRCFDNAAVGQYLAASTSPERLAEIKGIRDGRGKPGGNRNQSKIPIEQRWNGAALQGMDTVSLAVAQNAVIAVAQTAQPAGGKPMEYKAVALNAADGQLIWQRPLPSEPLPGGLLIDRDGQVVVTLLNGSAICLGKEI